MQLLERDSHLSSLREYAEDARRGRGRLVLLAGEAGVGKSALLDRFEDELADATWAWGACDGLFTPRPLGPLLDIAAQLGGELAELVAADAARDQLFSALVAHLTATDRLVVLVVEDVHWADEATLDLVRFIGRRVRSARALVLVSYRDEGLAADDPLRVAVGQLSGQRATRRIRLPRLSEPAVVELSAGFDIDPHRLHELTAGNPFYVTEVLRTPGRELPRSVRDAVLARTANLSDDGRRTVEVAALLGGSRLEPALLLAVAGTPAAALDELVDTGSVIADGSMLRFRHEIARRAVEESIPPHRATSAHRRILDQLLTADEVDAARLAHHAERAGDQDLVREYAPQAGRRASALAAHREAAVQFERAIRASAGADLRTAAEWYDAWAHELALVDRWQDSADAREQALRRWRDLGDRLREGDSLRRLSRTMWRVCRGDAAEAAAVGALEALEPLGPSSELAWAYANLANHRLNRGEHEDAIIAARQAREQAERFELQDVLSDALNTEACASALLGRVWSPLLRRALEVAKAERLDEQAGRAYANLYAMYTGSLKIAEGESVYVEGLAYCDEHDVVTFSACLRGERCHVLERLGRWDEATELAEGLLRQGGLSPVNRLNPLISLGRIKARQGKPGAWECLDEAATLASGVQEPDWLVLARTARAEAAWLEGRPEEAAQELDLADSATVETELDTRSAIAAWRHRITGVAVADELLREPWACEVSGDAERACSLWDRLGLPYAAALALLASNDESALRDAVSRLDRLGATAAVQLARQVLRRKGVRSVPSGVRASTRAHPAGLTRREQDVLELLAEGLTNDAIAARLFVSAKTVDHHVSAVLTKLGVPTRQAAAAEAARRGLVGLPG